MNQKKPIILKASGYSTTENQIVKIIHPDLDYYLRSVPVKSPTCKPTLLNIEFFKLDKPIKLQNHQKYEDIVISQLSQDKRGGMTLDGDYSIGLLENTCFNVIGQLKIEDYVNSKFSETFQLATSFNAPSGKPFKSDPKFRQQNLKNFVSVQMKEVMINNLLDETVKQVAKCEELSSENLGTIIYKEGLGIVNSGYRKFLIDIFSGVNNDIIKEADKDYIDFRQKAINSTVVWANDYLETIQTKPKSMKNKDNDLEL